MFQRYLSNLSIAWEAIAANRLRAALTTLGIIFGVAAVIAMLAIGNGAQQEIMEQIKLVGVNNIVISPIIPDPTASSEEKGSANSGKSSQFSQGLTLADARSIQQQLPTIKLVSPEIVLETAIIHEGSMLNTKLVGVEPAYFELVDFQLNRGSMFSQQNITYGDRVCIIGQDIATKLFGGKEPLGKSIKCGEHWLEVIGVLEKRNISKSSMEDLGIRNYDLDIYTPTQTALIRYRNRSLLTKAQIRRADQEREDQEDSEVQSTPVNYHQLDRLVVQVSETKYLRPSQEIIARMLKRRHYEVTDYQVEVPELLLKQQQRTKSIFNLVLGVIAGISLLVGGIGIMNIMLASVLERIKEIGLRLSVGAKKQDIVLQFMFESILISLFGGLMGVILGVVMAYFIAQIAEIPTIISISSILISFLVSAGIGLIFGITPARKAAQQDPITSLRYE